MGHHFAGLTSSPATGFACTKMLIINGVWLESSPHKKICEAFWQFEGQNWLLWEDSLIDRVLNSIIHHREDATSTVFGLDRFSVRHTVR